MRKRGIDQKRGIPSLRCDPALLGLSHIKPWRVQPHHDPRHLPSLRPHVEKSRYQEYNSRYRLTGFFCSGTLKTPKEGNNMTDRERLNAHFQGPFKDLFSLDEAARLCKKDPSTIRKAIADGRLREGTDCMKFGKQWIITKDGIHRYTGTWTAWSNLRARWESECCGRPANPTLRKAKEAAITTLANGARRIAQYTRAVGEKRNK